MATIRQPSQLAGQSVGGLGVLGSARGSGMSAENRHLPHLKLVKVRQKVEAAFAICEKKTTKITTTKTQ